MQKLVVINDQSVGRIQPLPHSRIRMVILGPSSGTKQFKNNWGTPHPKNFKCKKKDDFKSFYNIFGQTVMLRRQERHFLIFFLSFQREKIAIS